MGVPEILDPLAQLALPPGFRFYPTDEELLVQYLCRKVAGHHFNLQIIGEIDLYKFDPWVLPSKALFGEKEWYFFSPRERKYPNGSRPNRVAGSGYWKATGTDKIITTDGRKVGIKKALVFYVGKAPKGLKTNWIMHEYRLIESSRKHGSPKLDGCVLCRIYKKSSASSNQKPMQSFSSKEHSYGGSTSSSSSHLDDVLESLPDIENRFFSLPRINSLNQNDEQKLKFQSFGSGSSLDWAMLAELNSELELGTSTGGGGGGGGQIQSQTQAIMNSNNVCNDKYVPFVPQISQVEPQLPKQRIKIDEELLSGFRNQQNPNVYQSSFINSTDSFGYRYPTTQSSGYGFRQGSK